MTKVTGWDNGLSQDYDKGLGRWFANRLGARQQLRQDFEMTQVLIDRATLEQLLVALEKHHKQETRYSDNKRRANAICAHFTVNPLQELAEQAYMLTHGKETIEALSAGRAALAQQELPQKARPDFMAGYDVGMADAKRMAQHGEQQGEPTDDQLVKGVKAMRLFVTKNSVADFKLGYIAALAAAPAPQAQQGELVAQARLGMQDGLAMALSVVELYGMKGDVIYREIAKLRDGIAAAPAPQPAQEPRHTIPR